MPADALALALAAAVVHAAWNVGLAGAKDVHAATAVALVTGAIAFAPVAILSWDVSADAWPWVAASVVLELAYFGLLATAYSRAEMSVVYPIARGAAPVLVLIAVRPDALQAAGVLLVAAGVVAVRGPRPGPAADVALALAVAATIAGYTLVDNEGLRHADSLPYRWLVSAPVAAVYALFLGRARIRPEIQPRALASGLGMFAAYGLVLAALDRGPAAGVAAVRETSVVFGVLLAWLLLHERVGPARLGGSLVVAAGVVLLTL